MRTRFLLSIFLAFSMGLTNIPSAEAYSLTGSCIKATVKSAYPLQAPAEFSTASYQISYINTCEEDISTVEIGIGVLVSNENKVITTGGILGLVKSYQSGSLSIDLKYSEYKLFQKFNFLIKEVKSKSLTFISTTAIEFASGNSQSPSATPSATTSPAPIDSQELMYSQNVGGVTFSWPQKVYAPQSLEESRNAKFELSYQNKSGKDLYYIGYTLKNSGSVAEDLKIPPLFGISIPIKNGASGKFETSLSYTYFLNVKGPVSYTMNLCHTESLLSKETCEPSIYPLTFVTTVSDKTSLNTPTPITSPSKEPTTASNNSTGSPSKPKTVFLTVHYQRPAADYLNWQLWLWRNLEAGQDSNVNESGINFTGNDGFGKVATVVIDNMDKYDNIGLIVRKGEWLEKDINIDRFLTKFDADGRAEIWLRQGDPVIYYSDPSPSKSSADAESKAKQEADAKTAAELKAKQNADLEKCLKLTESSETLRSQIEGYKVKFPGVSDFSRLSSAVPPNLYCNDAFQSSVFESKLIRLENALVFIESEFSAAVKRAMSSAKKTTITCTKGKLIKKVTGVKPTCPTGYKKK